jgi:hypothetical protein
MAAHALNEPRVPGAWRRVASRGVAALRVGRAARSCFR